MQPQRRRTRRIKPNLELVLRRLSRDGREGRCCFPKGSGSSAGFCRKLWTVRLGFRPGSVLRPHPFGTNHLRATRGVSPRNHPWTEPVNPTAHLEKETVDEDVPASRCRGRRVDCVSRGRAGATARERRSPGLCTEPWAFGRLRRRLCVRSSSSPLALTSI